MAMCQQQSNQTKAAGENDRNQLWDQTKR